MSRLRVYYEDLRARFIGRAEMNGANAERAEENGDVLGQYIASIRMRQYLTVLDDLWYLLPKVELPWKAAAKRYRRWVRASWKREDNLRRELRNAYEKRDHLAGELERLQKKVLSDGGAQHSCYCHHSPFEYCAECDR